MSNEALYTILYPFMSSVLRLSGYEKEAFAVIFNFWMKAGEIPVRASLTTIQKITGGSRPAISQAVKALVKRHIISSEKHPGKPTMYSVTISPELLTKFKTSYKQKPVKSLNHQGLTSLTTSGSSGETQNKTKCKSKNDMTLRVRKQDEISTGGLPEAK